MKTNHMLPLQEAGTHQIELSTPQESTRCTTEEKESDDGGLDESTEENSEKETTIWLKATHSKVIDYHSNSECKYVDVQEALLEELSVTASRIKKLKKQIRVL